MHPARPEHGCVVAALTSKMERQPASIAKTSVASVRSLVASVESVLSAAPAPADATTIAATLVGSLQIARALDAEGKAVLAAVRSALLDRYDTESFCVTGIAGAS